MEITQINVVERVLDQFGLHSTYNIPTTPDVELGPRRENEPTEGWP